MIKSFILTNEGDPLLRSWSNDTRSSVSPDVIIQSFILSTHTIYLAYTNILRRTDTFIIKIQAKNLDLTPICKLLHPSFNFTASAINTSEKRLIWWQSMVIGGNNEGN